MPAAEAAGQKGIYPMTVKQAEIADNERHLIVDSVVAAHAEGGMRTSKGL